MKPHRFLDRIGQADFVLRSGAVTRIGTEYLEADGPSASVGDYCEINNGEDHPPIIAEVVSVERDHIRMLPFSPDRKLRLGMRVTQSSEIEDVPVGDGFCGRAVDALARPIDDGGAIAFSLKQPRAGRRLPPLDRVVSGEKLTTGIRALDGLLPLGKGQRTGIFAASGVGKTSLVDQLSRQIDCDHTILCLVGERGREVERLWRTLGSGENRQKFTLVAATADECASLRVRAVDQALGLAEFWRDLGRHVLLLVDSITRVALALRELGLAAGEPPTVRAFTPNVFSTLPKIVERCGASKHGGAITTIMSVLSETDDVDDPIVELMKSVLDGHIVLSRTLAEKRHFPAIDITRSVSRLANDLFSREEAELAARALTAIGKFEECRPMVESGIYRQGTSTEIDRAIEWQPALEEFLRQGSDHQCGPETTITELSNICRGSELAR